MKSASKPRLPDPGPLPGFEGKKLSRIGVACSGDLKDAIRAEAQTLGITMSAHMAILAGQRIGMQRATGKSRLPDPLLTMIDELRGEAQAALLDGAVSNGERAAMTQLLSDALHRLWGRRTA